MGAQAEDGLLLHLIIGGFLPPSPMDDPSNRDRRLRASLDDCPQARLLRQTLFSTHGWTRHTHARTWKQRERMKKMRRPQLSLVYNIPSSTTTWHEGRACKCCSCIYDKLTRLTPIFLFTSDCCRLVRGRSVNHPEAGHGDWSFMDVDFVSSMVRIFMGCNSIQFSVVQATKL